jgi:hypothetical protein
MMFEVRVPRLVDFEFGPSAGEPLCADELLMVVNELADYRVPEARFFAREPGSNDDLCRAAEHARRRRMRTILSVAKSAQLEHSLEVPCDVVSVPPWFGDRDLARVAQSRAELELTTQLPLASSWHTDGDIVVRRGVARWRIEVIPAPRDAAHIAARVRDIGALPLERISVQNIDRESWGMYAARTASPGSDRKRFIVGRDERLSIRRNGEVVICGVVVGSVRKRQVIALYSKWTLEFNERRSRIEPPRRRETERQMEACR